MSGHALLITDGEGQDCRVGPIEADRLWRLTRGLESATVSACPTCRSRVLAAVALVDLLDECPPFEAADALRELADEAPTLHLYVIDSAPCAHRAWRDPGYEEWRGVATNGRRFRRK
ncbi:MAG: hypothetical protein ACOYNI_08580 [Acidimicrobiia bacterium]